MQNVILTKMQIEVLSALRLMAVGEGDSFRYSKNAIAHVLGVRNWGSYRNEVMQRLVYMGLCAVELTKHKGRYTYYWSITYAGQMELEKVIAAATKGERQYISVSALDMSGAR